MCLGDPLKAILLAAGEGTRLRPITETRPKALIPVLCKPLLQWHLEALLQAGAEEVFLVVGYMKDLVVNFVETLSGIRNRIKLVYQEKQLGTGDAVVKAAEAIGPSEEVIVTYSDLFFEDWGLYHTLTKMQGYYVVGSHIEDPRDYGVLVTSGLNLIRIIEKPSVKEPSLVNVGVYKLNTSDILENRDVKPSPRGELEFTDIVSKIAAKKPVRVLNISGEWLDVGKPWHVIDANKIALRNIRSSIKGRVKEPVHIVKPVYIGENTVVHSFTTIVGPAYIDDDVEIGPNAYIRPWSVICKGSRIGFSVEVKESVIFEHVHASHLTYIGDSVICEHVNLGAGTVLANLRFDRKTIKMLVKGKVEDTGRQKLGAIIGGYAQTGVNVSVMPGVKIGSYSWILPGSVVYRDVPPNTIYPSRENIKYGALQEWESTA